MNQPKWKCIGQLGDVNPTEYGGYWVFIDETGIYPPEGEMLFIDDDGSEETGGIVYRFILEDCTYINGILSDNRFYPESPAWFAKPESRRLHRPQDTTYLRNVARFYGVSTGDVVAQFTSPNPLRRAEAWRAVGEFHGFDNLDSYPLTLTMAEVEKRYNTKLYEV